MMSYLNTNMLLSNFQIGFRPNYSILYACAYLTNEIAKQFNQIKIVLSILLDLSTAFDTLNHSIFLKKLDSYGVQGPSHNRLKSYLSNRTQAVSINDCLSSQKEILFGVPQGSTFAPLLFL